ncbi:hypothetical protein HY636_02370 [Candidatus Woesearchaeota archaeon]|nr:hypothetical protein [Candidatus Woesearchaeota archaeon]
MVLQINQAINDYSSTILKTARLYYCMYIAGQQRTDVDCADLEQAGRIAVFNISSKRPEKLGVKAYVNAAIRYAVLGEMKKMRHRVKQTYLVHKHDELVPIVDLLPTRETVPERLEQIDDILYCIRQEFSSRESDALDYLVQKCNDVYDLDLSSPLPTDTKDRVKVVTAMDLDDEEMMIYAHVLTGARKLFPSGYLSPKKGGKERLQKYFKSLLSVLGVTPKEFAARNDKQRTFLKYRLQSFLCTSYGLNLRSLLQDVEPSIRPEEINQISKWKGQLSAEEISESICNLTNRLGKTPREMQTEEFRFSQLNGMLQTIFSNAPRLAIEFAYPGTYPQHTERAMEIRRRFS